MEDDLMGVDLTAAELAVLDKIEKTELQKIKNELNQQVNDTLSELDFDAAFFNNDPQMEHLECLQSKFSHNSFRPKQWEIIQSIIQEKRDVCAVMSTGYGKSLCFQFPAVFTNGIVLVISPLIALMQAQVITLLQANVSACLVGSAQKDNDILTKIKNGEFAIIYSSPENLQGSRGMEMLKALNGKLTLIAIDEAHCVSQWGHDFRPDFRRLNIIREIIPDTPILAVTATATKIVRKDIISILGLRDPNVFLTSFDRPNLEFSVYQRSSIARDLPSRVRTAAGSVIVYVLTKKETEEIASYLTDIGIICEPYHGGMDIARRTEVLRKFLNDELKIIVATIAFGMGIDKKDIRCVIHYGASKNIETYYQEVGRAGRDGEHAQVITFFSPKDFKLHDYFLNQDDKKGIVSREVKRYLESLAMKMRQYLYSSECRRKTILAYFGEDTSTLVPREKCCDNCTRVISSPSGKNLTVSNRNSTVNNNFVVDRYIEPPVRSFQYGCDAQYVLDLLFGPCVNCAPSHHWLDSEEGDYESFMSGYEEFGYDNNSDDSNNEEERSGQEDGSDDEARSNEDERSDEERSENSENKISENESSENEERSDGQDSSQEVVDIPSKRQKRLNS